MANEFEQIHDVDDLDDDELRDLIRAHLRAHNGLDPDYITVRVDAGHVTLEGRVGTDYERRVAEHVLTDVLGLSDVTNDLVVQALHRTEAPTEIFEHLVEEDRESGLQLGDRPVPMDPEADDLKEDLDARMFGTTDIGKAISDGTPWVPPASPTQEGLEGPGLEGPSVGPSPGEDH